MNTQVHPNMVQGMATFNSGKPAGDIDLIAEVRSILVGFIPEAQVAAHYDTHRFIIEAQGKVSDVQKFLLNRYWFFQFATCPNNMTARLGLLQDGDAKSWLEVFKMTCVGFINQHSLPKAIDLQS